LRWAGGGEGGEEERDRDDARPALAADTLTPLDAKNPRKKKKKKRLLTLPSNERIRVLPHMKLVFEIRDLKYATPATATRAGILYVSEAPGSSTGVGGGSSGSGNATTATTTGGWQWRAYVGAWLQRAARPYAEAARSRDKDSGVLAWLQALFDAYVPALLAACSRGGPGFSPATLLAPINQVASLCSLLEALLRPESVPGNRPESKPLIEALFVFSAVWAFGGPLVERDGVDHRRAFDRWWRGAFGAGGVLGVLSGDGGGGAGGNNNNPDAAAAIAAASAALRFPPATKGTVFDYYVCLPAKAGAGGAAGLARFAPWADTLPADDLSGSAAPGGVTFSPPLALLAASSAASGTDDLFVPTPETAALRFVLDAVAVGLRRPAMLVGGAGVGKTRLVRALLADLDARPDSDDGGREFAPSVTLPLNYYTDVASFQRAIEAPLEKKVGAAYGPPAGTRRLVYFVDDLNMPRLDSYGTAMPLSLARQVFSTGRWYDRQKLTPRSVSGVQALAAMNPAAGAFAVNPRLQRLFFAVGVAPPGREALMRIFGAVLGAHLSNPALCGGQGAPEDVQSLGARLLQASLALHERVQASFRKTTVNFHYEFSVRHLAELVKGLTRASSAGALATPARAARLWAHETMRVYSDRLSSAADVEAFGALLAPLAKKMLPLPDADEYCLPFGGGGAGASAASAGVVPREPKRPLLFCNFAGAGGGKGGNSNGGALPYEEAGEGGLAAASRALAEALAEYNGGGGGGGGNGAMDLVLFDDAVRHVARIARAISLPGGHALLVGVGGSGKQSLARLAAHVCGYVTVSPTPCSSGGGGGSASSSSSAAVAQFRDDLARALRRAGVRGEGVAFLLPDGAVSDERALVPVSDMMAGGAPPADIFSPEDRDEICAALRAEAKSLGLQDTPDSCWRLFARNVKSNLHFVVTASPVGEALRARAQRFPAMVAAAAAVDWFHPWPEASLRAVSRRFLDGVEFSAVADGGGGEGGQMQQQAASGTAESSSSDAVLITVPPAARRDAVVEFLPFVFASVGRAGAQLWAREKRRAHTTPKSHLECTRLFRSLLARRRRAAAEALGRLDAGLDKLRRTQAEADVLVAEAREVAATVERKVASANAFAAEAAAEKEKASAEGAAAALEAERCAAIAAEVSDKQAACERDLAAAEPLVAQAEAALNTLNKKDLGELKSLKTPPAGVDDVTAAVVVLLDAAPKDRGWPAAQKAMANVDKFLERLRSFKAAVDQSKLARKTVDAVRPYLALPHFSGSAIAAKSKAAAGLCEWALNIVRYYDVVSEVEPKRQELAAANARLAEAGEQLAAVQARKRELDARVAELEARAKVAIDDRDAALAEQKRCALKLELAGRLIAALASEGERWTREAAELRAGGRFLVGDTLMAAAFVSYAGPFPAAYRASLVSEWHAFLLAKGAACPVSDRARDPVALLADEAAVAGWLRQGLPSDPSSVQNGAIVGNTERWPLLIDPQLQGLMWLRQREAAAAAASGGGGGAGASPSAAIPGGGISARVGADGYLATVERALERGLPLLIKGVGEGPLDPALADVVRRAYTRRGRATYVKLAGKDVEVAPGFRLVLHTKLSSPDLPPEVHAECAVVNFAVTEQGLQEQILALVVARERPDLERAKQGLLAQSAEFTIRLKALEDGLLAQLSAAEGDVTEDVALITSLEQSKAAAAEVAAKQRAALATQLAIDASREAYRPVAARGALLFFVLNGLGRVHAFYRWSLAAFLAVFARGLDSAPGGGGGGPAAAGGGKAKKAGVPPPTPLADCAVVAEAPTPKQQ
jgi:dynein heavy chain